MRTGRGRGELDSLAGPFDTILLYDLLEHLVDPWERAAAAARGRRARREGARLDAERPPLDAPARPGLRGTFGYTPAEHRDVTHLRWFTRRDLVELLESTGWAVDGVDFGALRPVSKLAAKLTRGLSAELLAYQLSALAHRR